MADQCIDCRARGLARLTPLREQGNDRWQASFTPGLIGPWEYTVSGRVDYFASWRRDLALRAQAGDDLAGELAEGRLLIDAVATRAPAADAAELAAFAAALSPKDWQQTVHDDRLLTLMSRHADRSLETWLTTPRPLWVDRERAAFASWYEAFPRSWGPEGQHGTLGDLADQLGYIADMGFDVLYLTPIHPIGQAYRKGKNNALTATPEDVGSPWGIGSESGGHTAIHPDLGTFADFEYLRQQAARHGMELALDLALQCSPDHPWVTEHPEWFRHRADGSIRYAENPPKKYQDPKTMYRLAKLGFTQSYTYFTWRTEKRELSDYLTEVSTPPVSDFFRPNFFTNTPDILHATLQEGGRPMFMARLTLAALSVGNWGIYGPAMELLEATPREPGSEEYLDSEKYEIRQWNLHQPDSLAPFITALNTIRRTEPALTRVRPPLVQPTDNDQLLAWCRFDAESGNRVVVVVNLQPQQRCRGSVYVNREQLGIDADMPLQAIPLVDGSTASVTSDSIDITCTPARPVAVLRLVKAPTQLTLPEATDG
ncbi:MAG: DUF3416 domain-containing protein [Planctomycetia bacterium]|nr:DUF3416 domain-containing protein [Planctomycetia bacterium]